MSTLDGVGCTVEYVNTMDFIDSRSLCYLCPNITYEITAPVVTAISFSFTVLDLNDKEFLSVRTNTQVVNRLHFCSVPLMYTV